MKKSEIGNVSTGMKLVLTLACQHGNETFPMRERSRIMAGA